jgi:hypothetical protein
MGHTDMYVEVHMELLIMLFPMLIDQIKAMGQSVDDYKPAMTSSIKVYPGMPIAKVLVQTGLPISVSDVTGTFQPVKMLAFKGDLCEDVRKKYKENCYVFIKDGKVDSLSYIHPKHMGLM